jgi:hypothetical protein
MGLSSYSLRGQMSREAELCGAKQARRPTKNRPPRVVNQES